MIKKFSIFLISITLFAFTTGDNRGEYTLPLRAQSVCTADLDLDGGNDVIVGHNYSTCTDWSGVSILLNSGTGYLELFDSIYLYGGQIDTKVTNLNQNPIPEIIGKYVSIDPLSEHIAIIYDFNVKNISYLNLKTLEGVNVIEMGDINGEDNIDIIVASNNGQ